MSKKNNPIESFEDHWHDFEEGLLEAQKVLIGVAIIIACLIVTFIFSR